MTIDLRPMVIATGSTPMFRDLRRGDTGPDVAQLQRLLNEQGRTVGRSGIFDAATDAAVTAWQSALGVTADGIVRAGDLVFAPQLPIRVSPAQDVVVGAAVSTGMPLLDRVAAQPTVQLHYSVDQAALNPHSGNVVVTVDGHRWQGTMGTPDQRIDGEVYIPLLAQSGGPICGDECEQAIPVGDATLLSVDVAVVPPATGPVVPVAAISTGPDNTTTVRGDDGSTIDVTVRTVANGLAVVDGVDIGRTVLVPSTRS